MITLLTIVIIGNHNNNHNNNNNLFYVYVFYGRAPSSPATAGLQGKGLRKISIFHIRFYYIMSSYTMRPVERPVALRLALLLYTIFPCYTMYITVHIIHVLHV